MSPSPIIVADDNPEGYVFEPIDLPCGMTLQNRLVKVHFCLLLANGFAI
jgi:2,4-dienoyl-CoA reductase-like NADH-dependent reductase (Old Yellow Enzyme family)